MSQSNFQLSISGEIARREKCDVVLELRLCLSLGCGCIFSIERFGESVLCRWKIFTVRIGIDQGLQRQASDRKPALLQVLHRSFKQLFIGLVQVNYWRLCRIDFLPVAAYQKKK